MAATSGTGGLAFVLPATLGVINHFDTIHSFDYYKSSSISQLIDGK